jgi:hypothetical protein
VCRCRFCGHGWRWRSGKSRKIWPVLVEIIRSSMPPFQER